jgi:hypothetical protein
MVRNCRARRPALFSQRGLKFPPGSQTALEAACHRLTGTASFFSRRCSAQYCGLLRIGLPDLPAGLT